MFRYDDQSDADKKLVDVVRRGKESADPFHRRWREIAEKRYALYRSYQAFKDGFRKITPNDADDYYSEMRRTFGDPLFIPYCFATVETTLPRMLSDRPRVRARVPRLLRDPMEMAESNAAAVGEVVDAQMEQIDYELVAQDVGKSGLIYGLGVQKEMWRTEKKKLRGLRKATAPMEGDVEWLPTDGKEVVLHDDPDSIWVDPFDFFYDPFGWDMETVEFAIHRTWRSRAYLRKMVETGAWRNLEAGDIDSIEPSHPSEWDKVTQMRLEARGFADLDKRSNTLHEVWEYHDSEQMITVLDNEIVVASGPCPYWRTGLPFSIYRPTKVPGELPGIGEVEPIEDLQREMNELRTQRRDNAVLVLNKPFAYWDGLVDPDEIRFGAGSLIPTPGDPRELIRPLDVGDIPGSGYQEAAEIQSDIQRVSGISDPASGGGSDQASFATATGAQLIHQATSVRIAQKAKRLRLELVKQTARKYHAMNQQKIRSNRQVRLPDVQAMQEEGAEEKWRWLTIGPEELMGNFEFYVEDSEPENIPQRRQDGQMKMQMLGQHPAIEQRKILVSVMRDLGIEHPETYLAPPGPKFPAIDPNKVGQILVENFQIPPDQVNEILQAGQIAAMEQGAVSAREENAASENGGAPPPAAEEEPPIG